GCESVTTRDITVFPAADFALELSNDSACSPLELTLPIIDGAEDLVWNFGDGTTGAGQAPSHTWANPTGELLSHTISFTAETANGCPGAATAQVHIKPQPEANFSADAITGCEPLLTTFANESTNGDTFIWNFGEAGMPGIVDNSASVQNTFEAAASDAASVYTITLLAIDDLGCSDERTMTVEVSPTPEFELTLEAYEGCSPLALTMPEMTDAVETNWNFGDGTFSNEATPAHFWTNSANELTSHTIAFQGFNAFGCEGTATAEVSIMPQPQAIFSLSEESGCAPLHVEVANESQLGTTFAWNFGDGTAASTDSLDALSHTYTGEEDPVDYTVTLTATHALGCADTLTKTVTVLPEVTAAWAGETIGCAPLNTAFEYTGTDVPNIDWTLDGAAAATGDTFSVALAGATGASSMHTVSVEATSEFGCAGSATFEVTVNPVPVVGLTASSAATCSGDAWTVVQDVQFADAITLTFNGESIDPSDLTFNTLNAAATDTTATVVLNATTDAGCAATASIEHTVHPEVVAAFELPTSTCSPMEVTFENQSIQATASTTWNFGNGEAFEALNPTHLFEANGTEDEAFEVTLVATNTAGCADTTTQVVTVWGNPEAALAIVEAEGCYPVDVTFANSSSGFATTEWAYGNGEFSAIGDSVHTKTFFNPTSDLVVYTTEMTVTNVHGCAATDAVEIEVGPYLNAQFDVVAQGCTPVEANIINQSEGAAAYIWNFSDGSAPSNESNPT
ncbi:MAG: PKD domain-containing protein, partial [Flavobacteriales bacterium]